MTFQAEFSFKSNVEENTLTLIFSVVGDAMKQSTLIEKVYAEPHLNGNAHPIYLDSCHSIPCYKLLEAHFTVSGTKMTITNKILTNQRRPYK